MHIGSLFSDGSSRPTFSPAKDGLDMRGVFALKPNRGDWVFNSELTPGFPQKLLAQGYLLHQVHCAHSIRRKELQPKDS